MTTRRHTATALSCFAAAIAFGIYTDSANATVLYDNGPMQASPAGYAGIGFGTPITADDFVLDADAELTSMLFPAFHTLNGGLGPTIDWFIYQDGSGTPGDLLYSGQAANVATTTLFTTNGGTNIFEVAFDFDAHVELEGGKTYWIGLNSSGGFAPPGLVWATSTTRIGNDTKRLFPSQTEWMNVARDLSFTLVPGPGALAFLAVGVIGVGGRRRNL